MQLLLRYVQLLQSVKIVEQQPPVAMPSPKNGKISFFDKYNGSLKSRMPLQEIDARLHQLRQEWERDTW
ncbi:MAG: hypothetical protein IPM82_10070 [Saprospiraceae bacterium]|nr:hypothetical protein [Saprospiraceae bacterium]